MNNNLYTLEHVCEIGDATADYRVIIHKTVTLRDFIKTIISDKREWGNLGIKSSDLDYVSFGNPSIEYSHGIITTPDWESVMKSYLDKKVVAARYNGGWSYGSWQFEVEE